MTRTPAQCAEALLERFAQSLAHGSRIDLTQLSKEQNVTFLTTVKAEAQRTACTKVAPVVIADGTALPFEMKASGAPTTGSGADATMAGGPAVGGTSMADTAPFSIVGLLSSAVGALVRRSRANRKVEAAADDGPDQA